MTEDPITPPPAKLDPESLAIRARPRRTIRFKRGVIIAIAAMGSVSLITVTWVALRPTVFRHVVEQEEQSQPGSRPNTDALAKLPASYGDVPRFGQPLPGDLGKPILDRQQALADDYGTDAVWGGEQAKASRAGVSCCRGQDGARVRCVGADAPGGTSEPIGPSAQAKCPQCRLKPERPHWTLITILTRRLWVKRGKPQTGHVFLNRIGKPYTDTRDLAVQGGNPLSSAHESACRRAGIVDFTVHDWRHHWASHCVIAGIDLLTITRLGGWRSLRMVQRYALDTTHMKQAVRKLC